MKSNSALVKKRPSFASVFFTICKIIMGSMVALVASLFLVPDNEYGRMHIIIAAMYVPASFLVNMLWGRSKATVLVFIVGSFIFDLSTGFYVFGLLIVGLVLFNKKVSEEKSSFFKIPKHGKDKTTTGDDFNIHENHLRDLKGVSPFSMHGSMFDD